MLYTLLCFSNIGIIDLSVVPIYSCRLWFLVLKFLTDLFFSKHIFNDIFCFYRNSGLHNFESFFTTVMQGGSVHHKWLWATVLLMLSFFFFVHWKELRLWVELRVAFRCGKCCTGHGFMCTPQGADEHRTTWTIRVSATQHHGLKRDDRSANQCSINRIVTQSEENDSNIVTTT